MYVSRSSEPSVHVCQAITDLSVLQDLGGRDKLRDRWRSYFSQVAAVIYVVDSTEVERLDDAAYELAALLDFTGMPENRVPLLVYANKQDLEGAKSAQEISEALRLGELRNRRWKTVACSAIDGTGIAEGMDWLVVSNSRLLGNAPGRFLENLLVII